MSDIIARGHKLSVRLFPPVNSNFYNTDQYAQLNPKQQAGLKVLDFANSKINPVSCLFGWQSKVPVKIRRLMLLHKNAVAAELEEQLCLADYYWKKFFAVLRSIYHKQTTWRELNKFVFSDAGNDPAFLRQAIIEEVFIDTHCAFYNGRIKKVKKLKNLDRGYFHLDCLERIFDITGIPRKKFPTISDAISKKKIEHSMKIGEGDQAIKLINGLLDPFEFNPPPDPSVLPTKRLDEKDKEGPFMYWFFSKHGTRYRVQIVLVFILITIAACISINDNINYDTRNKAFKQITTAAKSGDYIGIINGAETYFSSKILTKNDKRESYVKKLYAQAIVRLFMEQDEQLDDNALDHFKKYRQLIANSKK